MRLFGEVLVTMLVILDPPGNVPIFLAVTQRLSDKERHKAAFMAVGTAFFVISMFAIGGRTVLDYLHVSVPALQGAGGLLLLLHCSCYTAMATQKITMKLLRQSNARLWPWCHLVRLYWRGLAQ
jgi:small neutral amino acid transporter SnatA (MarC family)